MRMKTLLAAGAVSLALTAALAGCSTGAATGAGASASGDSMSSASASSTAAPMADDAMDATLTGTFSGLNDKKAAGDVTITGDTITLTGFSSDEGPDLHLYLTNGTSEADVTAGVLIDMVAWDKTSQTFTIPSGVDASDYTDLVEHCDKALAVFGAAALSK